MSKNEDTFSPLTGKAKRRAFIVLDLESKAGPGQRAGFTRPFMGGVYDGQTFDCFFDQDRDQDWEVRWYWPGGCIDRMMRFLLTEKNRGKHIYAHNAGSFDYLFLLPWLMNVGFKMGYRFSIIPVASSIQVLDVWNLKNRFQRWRFLDSLRLIPMGLDKASRTFGLGGKLEHDLHLPETDPRWKEYNQVDCVKLYKVLEKFHHYVENVLCGEVGITAPATAVKLLRRKYLKQSINRNVSTHDFVRQAYFGGRVEVFKRRGSGLRYYDINSSYPAAMLEGMPGSVCNEWQGEPPERFKRDRIGFCEVDILVPSTIKIPPLPVRGDGQKMADGGVFPKGKLLFPVGQLRGTWEWGEIQQALKMGCTIERWGKSVWYEQIPLFAEYVRDLYQYRDKSREDYNEGLALIAKLLLNSSYGKFGMRTLRKQIYQYDDPNLPDNAVPADQDPECLVWYAEEEVDAPYIMPQVAARVTALARVRLLQYMLQAEELGGVVHYCDTDSIITDVVMPSSTDLGGLKDEMPEQSGQIHGEFLGPKMYCLLGPDEFEQVKAKGFSTRDKATFNALAAGKTIVMRRLEKIGSLARAGFLRGPKMLKVPKSLRLDSGKRVMHDDGSTHPFELNMWTETDAI